MASIVATSSMPRPVGRTWRASVGMTVSVASLPISPRLGISPCSPATLPVRPRRLIALSRSTTPTTHTATALRAVPALRALKMRW